MEHYICTGGCKGSAKEPNVCQSEGCPNYGLPMEECDCTDGAHYERGGGEGDGEEGMGHGMHMEEGGGSGGHDDMME